MAKMPSTFNRIWHVVEAAFWLLVILFVVVVLLASLVGFVHAPGAPNLSNENCT